MKTMTRAAMRAAERFMGRNARLIDRHRFTWHFGDGPAEPVLTALRAYANPDGGFGNGLEPDLRGDDPAIPRLCDHLADIATPDGGVPFVLPTVRDAPHAPWWQPADESAGSLVPTATLAGLLHLMGVDHRWLGPATDFCWTRVDKLSEVAAYDALAVLTFLDHVPDRDRAAAAFDRLRGSILAHTALDPHAAGEVHFPYDFAPDPSGFGRRIYPDDVFEAHPDALVDAQRDDGGWPVNWLIWTPLVGHEWRAWMTLHRLRTLRAYGRLTP
jgi:hypothetical protein